MSNETQSEPAMSDLTNEQILKARQEGRMEALAIILRQDPESPFVQQCISGQDHSGEYSTAWDEAAMRKVLHIDDSAYNAFDKVEAQYWDYRYHALECEIAATERRTQPEATAPAQDLSAAIPNWSGIADRLNELDKAIVQSTNLTPQSKPRRLLYAILHEVCSSPANALSAGDRVDAERYRWLRDKARDGWDQEVFVTVDGHKDYYSANGIYENDLDELIDAAILQSQKNGAT